ncbi:hypothetical protein [Campylobacter sp. RM16188]|uniref:hypothetical protein n=1 Tax=Campylobacter sp. RM16188 TaxID=1705725 RepID=UPI00155327BC|nr:hypothetical protein [Campylobacter sp. RM16188]
MKKIVLLSLMAVGLVFGAQAGEKAEQDFCNRIKIYPKINMKAGECEFKDGKYILHWGSDFKKKGGGIEIKRLLIQQKREATL